MSLPAQQRSHLYLYLSPGCGVGGHCIPVDPYYLIVAENENDFAHDLLLLARQANDRMPKFTVGKLAQALSKLEIPINGARIAVLGLAYKPWIDDVRNSPSFEIIDELTRGGQK